MSFLAAVVAQFFQLLLTKVGEWLKKLWAAAARKKEAKEKSEQSVEPLKQAETADEIDQATDDALDGF